MWPCLVWGRGFLGLVALLRAFSLAAPGFEGAFFTSAGFLHTFLTSPGLEGPSLTLVALLRVIIADVSLVWIFLLLGGTNLKLPLALCARSYLFSGYFQVWI